MTDSSVKTYKYDNGEIQRVHLIKSDDWGRLNFFKPVYSKKAFDRICTLYKAFIVPKAPWVFGRMVLFSVPKGFDMGGICADEMQYGMIMDPCLIAGAVFKDGLKVNKDGTVLFTNETAKTLYEKLDGLGYVKVVCGKLPHTKILPVDDCMGFMSECMKEASVKVNANFFVMDNFDVGSPYDKIGTPIGLCVKDGNVINPPLFGREALMAEDGEVYVKPVDVTDLFLEINGHTIRAGERGTRFFSRPECSKTPAGQRTEVVIVGTRVVAVRKCGGTIVPSSGLVVCSDDRLNDVKPGDEVIYRGLEDVRFGIQVGNSIIADGIKTERFISKFYNIKHFWKRPYPPSLYPLDFEGARAPRIAIGSDVSGKPMIAWMEGASKLHYEPGDPSCGASLSEMATICDDLGFYNAVNLDGGGSAQILYKGARTLLISDKNPLDGTEAERAVPMGIYIE